MFGFISKTLRQGRQLAALLAADRTQFIQQLSSTLLGQNPDRLERSLRAFQVYCILATAEERRYGKSDVAILQAAINEMLCEGSKEYVWNASQLALSGFGVNQRDVRETVLTTLFTDYSSLSSDLQLSLRIRLNAFHQCTRLSIAGITKDALLVKQAASEAPQIRVGHGGNCAILMGEGYDGARTSIRT